MYLARILDDEGNTLVPEMMIPSPQPAINMSFWKSNLFTEDLDMESTEPISSYVEREAKLEFFLGPDDGGPLYIYRIKRNNV